MPELSELVKKQLEQDEIFNSTSPLTNFEMQSYYKTEPTFNGVYSKNNLRKIEHEACVINLRKKSIGFH